MERASIAKNRLFFWAVIIAILNPVFSGLILGFVMASEPDFKKEGRAVILFSIAWGIIAMLLVAKFKEFLFA